MSERICRPCEFKFAPGGAGSESAVGTFEGYGAVFGNVDAHGDLIAPGAFKKTLKAWKAAKKLPPMLLQHAGGMFSQTASDLVPIGVWDEMSEDDTGLAVRGHLIALDTDRGKSVHAAMRERALDGLSIGYRPITVTEGSKPTDPRRTLKELDLVELSVVTFPANADARVEAVKAAVGMTEREFERFLRDAGFSREQAKTITASGYKALQRDAADTESRDALTAAVDALAATMRG